SRRRRWWFWNRGLRFCRLRCFGWLRGLSWFPGLCRFCFNGSCRRRCGFSGLRRFCWFWSLLVILVFFCHFLSRKVLVFEERPLHKDVDSTTSIQQVSTLCS